MKNKLSLKYWAHRFGYNYFTFPKLSFFEIFELVDAYLEENKTDKQKKEDETNAIIENFRLETLKDNIEGKRKK